MRTVRRLFYVDIVSSVAFVALAFLSLFFFIDFVDKLSDVGERGRSLIDAVLHVALQMPGHLYELLPIAVLIGSIFALSRMAQSSEFTILRTGGLGPARALSLLAGLGLLFGVLTFLVGDFVAPLSERETTKLSAQQAGGIGFGRSGAWLKSRETTPQGEHNYSVSIGSAGPDGALASVRIFEHDDNGQLLSRTSAATAQVGKDAVWHLRDAQLTRWSAGDATHAPAATTERHATLTWASTLTAEVVAAAVLPVSNMSTVELFRYIGHLSENEQAAQSYQIQFWKRAFYPFACLVMVALALPFAYLHARAGGVSLKVFGGILLGISFVLLNNVAGHVGLLRNWTPWIVAAAPSALYLLLSLAAFSWLVRYR